VLKIKGTVFANKDTPRPANKNTPGYCFQRNFCVEFLIKPLQFKLGVHVRLTFWAGKK